MNRNHPNTTKGLLPPRIRVSECPVTSSDLTYDTWARSEYNRLRTIEQAEAVATEVANRTALVVAK